MATRFYYSTLGSSWDAAITPAFDVGWEQTGEALRKRMVKKDQNLLWPSGSNTFVTIPITTTQDILNLQLVSDPIPAQVISGTISYVEKFAEGATTNNAFLAFLAKVVSSDGSVSRGTMFSVFGTGTEVATSGATRIINAAAITPVTTQPGDRIVIEIGTRATAPTASGSNQMQNTLSLTQTDFALAEGGTAGNSWLEFSQNLWSSDLANYQFVKAGDGMSVTEKIR
jgi:hypothetical protein